MTINKLRGGTSIFLRCAKCGSDDGFIIELKNGRILEVKQIIIERIKATVRVTCAYCNTTWDHVPPLPEPEKKVRHLSPEDLQRLKKLRGPG